LDEASISGYQNTTIAKIATRAGVAKGVVNYHFGSKKALLREMSKTFWADLLKEIGPQREEDDFFSSFFLVLQTQIPIIGD
jgi:AcrR family transcriptional regulator